MTSLAVVPLQGLPLIRAGDDLVELVASSLKLNGVTLRAGDVLVVAQKIVSKAEGRVVDLATIQPSAQAVALAADVDKDPRLVEVILSESVRVVRARRGVLTAGTSSRDRRLGRRARQGTGGRQATAVVVPEPRGTPCARDDHA